MKNISEYINESGYDEIIRKNLAEISDEDITNEVRDYEGDNLSQKDILTICNHLKSLNSNKTQSWIVPPTPDVDDYNRACVKWAKDTAKKYGVDKLELDKKGDMIKILTGIAWVVNGI